VHQGPDALYRRCFIILFVLLHTLLWLVCLVACLPTPQLSDLSTPPSNRPLLHKGIRANAVAPGPVHTPLATSTFSAEMIASVKNQTKSAFWVLWVVLVGRGLYCLVSQPAPGPLAAAAADPS